MLTQEVISYRQRTVGRYEMKGSHLSQGTIGADDKGICSLSRRAIKEIPLIEIFRSRVSVVEEGFR